jgi:hypothetical protein
LLRTNNLSALQQALDRMYLSPADTPKRLYYLAQLAGRQNRHQEAKKCYDQALLAMPAHEPTVLAAAKFYTDKMRDGDKVYNLLLNSITYDPFNPQVYKAYILQSMAVGYSAFAESALEQLSRLIPPAELAAFRQQYQQKKAEREAVLMNGQ